MELYRGSTGALSVDGHSRWVAPERGDVLPHPLERKKLVVETCIVVTQPGIAEFWDRDETEGGEAVVYRDDNDVGALLDPVLEGPVRRISLYISCQTNL